MADELDDTQNVSATSYDGEAQVSPQDANLIARLQRRIRDDKRFHQPAFDRMRRNMQLAMHGADADWRKGNNYTANITGRHVKQRASALYAKNPRVVAKRREQMDFAVWDENPASLQLAVQTIQAGQMAQQVAAAAPPTVDPITGMAVPAQPELPPGFDEAMAVVQDYQQGTQRRQVLARFGKTLEILFSNQMNEQKPLVFKTGLKQLVRRTCVACVGYVELAFQRQTGPRPGLEEQLADSRQRLDHLNALAEQQAEGEMDDDAAERAELEQSIAALQAEPEIVLREGLIFDYPRATRVIPDKRCTLLTGFVGAHHLTVEYIYTCEEVKELFGVDLSGSASYTAYKVDGERQESTVNDVPDDNAVPEMQQPTGKKQGLVCVWKHYDKASGLVYYLADGCKVWLRPPAAPDVFVEDFWPVYALVFNETESENELFPPSDVELMLDMQREHNRSRQGMREHRHAARPRWVAGKGAFGSEEDPNVIGNLQPLQMATVNMSPEQKIQDIMQVVPVPGVDMNLYATEPYFGDLQLVVGAQESQFGGVSKATATESAIAANSTALTDSSSIDDLDAFLSVVARAGGQILMREMSEEQVKKIVGVGAVWPQMSLADIAGEVYLEVAAGSTGKPNQAVEVNNWKILGPLLQTTPGISPYWFGKETARRLDDKLDFTEAYEAGLPSIVAQNQLAGAPPVPGGPPEPGSDPNAQGGEGADKTPAPPTQGGSDAAFGSNQVESPV